MLTKFIDTQDETWEYCLKNTESEFYQTAKFLKLETDLIGGEALAWFGKIENEWVLIPLIRRRIPDNITKSKEYYDYTSPYGYPGFICSEGINTKKLTVLLKQFKTDGAKALGVSTFIRFNPILNTLFLKENEDICHVVHGRVVCISLNKKYDILKKAYSSNHRRDIKKLKKEGYYLEWNNWDDLESFISIYNETMEREKADNYYFFKKEYYEKLRNLCGDENIDLILVKNNENEAVAGGIFFKNNRTIQYHLGGTRNEFLRKAPSKMLFDGIIKKYSQVLEEFNLGGGVGNQSDSLFKFKSGFGKEFLKFSTLRIINDRQKYNNMCEKYTRDEVNNMEAFFPLYRKK